MLQLLNTIQSALSVIWDYRFSTLMRASKGVAQEGLSAEQAYRRGYADGYWQSSADLIRVLQDGEIAMLRLTQYHAARPLPSWRPLMDEVH